MKKLITTLMMALSLNATMAVGPIDPTDPGFQPCTDTDWELLRAATERGSRAINNLITEDIMPMAALCLVEKPRFFHPAVCGATIQQIDTFAINTTESESYTIKVDSSYNSCSRARIIPMIKSLEYAPIDFVYFGN